MSVNTASLKTKRMGPWLSEGEHGDPSVFREIAKHFPGRMDYLENDIKFTMEEKDLHTKKFGPAFKTVLEEYLASTRLNKD